MLSQGRKSDKCLLLRFAGNDPHGLGVMNTVFICVKTMDADVAIGHDDKIIILLYPLLSPDISVIKFKKIQLVQICSVFSNKIKLTQFCGIETF